MHYLLYAVLFSAFAWIVLTREWSPPSASLDAGRLSWCSRWW